MVSYQNSLPCSLKVESANIRLAVRLLNADAHIKHQYYFSFNCFMARIYELNCLN